MHIRGQLNNYVFSLFHFFQAVSVGKHVKGYHYIIANLVRAFSGIAFSCYFETFVYRASVMLCFIGFT